MAHQKFRTHISQDWSKKLTSLFNIRFSQRNVKNCWKNLNNSAHYVDQMAGYCFA